MDTATHSAEATRAEVTQAAEAIARNSVELKAK
jgi:hypothetical protein